MSYKPHPYNARHAAPREVAETFVVPDEFIEISKFGNTLLIGPRGTGKTTILKALTPSGLYHLNKREDLKDSLEKLSVDYIPIYIPAETSWKGDAGIINEAISDEDKRNHILNGLFVDHSLRWLILALEESKRIALKFESHDRPTWALNIDIECEEFLSRHFSDLWKLEKIQSSFLGLKLALIERSNIYRSAINSKDSERALEEANSCPALDVLQMFRGIIEIVRERFEDTKWSFNFDEMEIAPKHVISMLYENLRSWDQRAVLKFSLFPYVDFYSLEQKMRNAEKGPVDGPDYQTFLLTNDFAKHNRNFATELVKSECLERDITLYDFARYLNSSNAIQSDSRRFDGLRFERNYDIIFNRPFKTKTDSGLVQYLNSKGFSSAKELTSITGENNRAQHIRKIAPVVEFRNYYLSEQRGRKRQSLGRTSPKGFGYYHGYNQILALTEGNPRSIKFYVNELLDAMQASEAPSIAQNRIIRRNVDRFRALIASQVVPIEGAGIGLENSLNLVDRLGRMFTNEILSDKFKVEPRLSVIFNNIAAQTKRVIEVAINSGALVVDQSNNETRLIFDIDSQRVRLSHSFAPYHPLPTITGQPIKLSKIPEVHAFYSDQSDLLDWSEE